VLFFYALIGDDFCIKIASDVLSIVALVEAICFSICTIQSIVTITNIVVISNGNDWNRNAADDAKIVNPAFNNQNPLPSKIDL